jgi:hypothetical protein
MFFLKCYSVCSVFPLLKWKWGLPRIEKKCSFEMSYFSYKLLVKVSPCRLCQCPKRHVFWIGRGAGVWWWIQVLAAHCGAIFIQCIHWHMPSLVSNLGSSCPEMLNIIHNPPEGSVHLITLVYHPFPDLCLYIILMKISSICLFFIFSF